MSADADADAGADRADAATPRVPGIRRLALFVREDVRDTVRERQAHALVGLFVLLGGGFTYLAGGAGVPGSEPPELTEQLLPLFVFLLPLIALGFVAPVVVERRTTGALTLVLGLPFSRRSVVVGTVLGRGLVVVASALLGLLVAVPVAIVRGVALDPISYAAMAAALVLLGLTFVAIAVGISAVTRTSTRATVLAFGAYVLFVFQLWEQLPRLVGYVRNGFSWPTGTPAWAEFFGALNPMTAFGNAIAGISTSLAESGLTSPPVDPALYERPGFAIGVLLGWIVVVPALAARHFRATDV